MGACRAHRSLLFAALAVGISACDFAPSGHAPAMPVPAKFKETNGNWRPAAPDDEAARGLWWLAFGDKELNALEARFTTSNQDIKIMLARFEEARAQASYARADFFPVITGTASGTRNRTSSTVANARPDTLYNDYQLGADVSYELDVWGRVRNEVAAAKDLATAGKADLASVELSLRAELAGDYFALRADDSAQALLDETVADYKKALDVTRARFEGGVTAETDLDQAEAQYENTRTQASDMRLKRSQLEHAVAVLIGEPPASFTLAPEPLAATPLVADPGLPSTLLERRPDIAAAERRVAAANAEIGVARAAWFPVFSLTGSLGYETASGASFFSSASRFWSLGPTAALGFLDVGHLSALNDQALAVYDEQAASYRKTVLNAYQEVEDDLTALHRLSEENVTQNAATVAAYRALQREQDRYGGGLVTYLDVIVTQNTALQTKLSAIDILSRQMIASVQLVKALGGGWRGQTPLKWEAQLDKSTFNPDTMNAGGPLPVLPAAAQPAAATASTATNQATPAPSAAPDNGLMYRK